MDDWWKKAYKGDKGVPHADGDALVNIWRGCFAFAAVACLHSHTSNLAQKLRFNWSDNAIKLDHQHWRNILDKNKKQTSLSNGSGVSAK